MTEYLKKPSSWLTLAVLIYVIYRLVETGALGSLVAGALPPAVDEAQTVKEDQYYQYRIDLAGSRLSIEYRHLFGTTVDVYTLDQENYALFQKWVQGDRSTPVEYISALSRPGTSSDFSVSRQLNGSVYYVIIDNTDFGETKTITNFASDDARFHIVIR